MKTASRKTTVLLLAAAALILAVGAAPASADTGASLSYLTVDGCQCSYGSFSQSATSYSVDAGGAQSTAGQSVQTITVSAGNQTQAVQIAFSVNGNPVGSTSSSSGQQSGVYFTSAPITLSAGSNTISLTVTDPAKHLGASTVNVTVPYAPITLSNMVAPVATANPNSCDQGTWQADPAANYTVSWQGSQDGQSWTGNISSAKYIRCEVSARNGYMTVTADSAAVPYTFGGPTGFVSTPAKVASASSTTTSPPVADSSASPATPSAAQSAGLSIATNAVAVAAVAKAKPKAATVAAQVEQPKYLKVEKPAVPVLVHRIPVAVLARLFSGMGW